MTDLIALKRQAKEYEDRFQFQALIDLLYDEWQKNKADEGLSMLLLGECFYVPYFTIFTTDDYEMAKDAELDSDRVNTILREVYLSGKEIHENSPTYCWFTSLLISTQPIAFELAIPNFPKDEYIHLAEKAHALDPLSQLALSQWKLYNKTDNKVLDRTSMIQELKALRLQHNMVDQNLAWYFANYRVFDDIPMEEITE